MEQNRESLEKTLKIHMDKLKQKLGLKFSADSYVASLSDSIIADVVITKGDVVTVRIRTDILIDVLNEANVRRIYNNPVRTPTEREFQTLLERTLHQIPRLFDTLAHPAAAHAIEYERTETGLGRRTLTKEKYEDKYRNHPYDREIHYSVDFRCTAIHWKSGTILRDFGRDKETATTNARRRIIELLRDETIYKRESASFQMIEPHEDIIYDIVLDAKVLNKDEVRDLIHKLDETYLKD